MRSPRDLTSVNVQLADIEDYGACLNLDRKDRQELTNPINLTPFQQDVIRGTMLGDAHLRPHENGRSFNLDM